MEKIVRYNEDDVRATARVWQWLAQQHDPGGAGAASPRKG